MSRLIRVGAVLGLLATAGGLGWMFRHRLVAVFTRSRPADTMALPATGAPADATPRGDVAIDLRRQQLTGVRTAKAARVALGGEIRAVGSVRYDETTLADINVRVDGWIRDLLVDYTGQRIERGQPLFTLYSPELLATESEYVLALKARDQMQSSQMEDARTRADQLVASARRRLALWDLSEEDLQALETTRQPRDVMTFRSPVAGLVVEKTAVRGLRVEAGQSLYKTADVGQVWVEAEVHEQDMPLVRIGDRATVSVDAYPDERLAGRVIYIYPYLSEQTRTNKVRYAFANAGGRLKPGMFATVTMSTSSTSAIAVPADAVLDSGREQLVFVAEGEGHFTPRRVTVGRRSGDRVQILTGLKEGEDVATGATFFLDSESQLRAAAQGYAAPPVSATPAATSPPLQISLRTTPDPPKAGENQFEARVADAAGAPIDNAEVVVQLFMAAMPTMNMPAMRNDVRLTAAGGGVYLGTGPVMSSGTWDVTVTVTRQGARLGSTRRPLIAQ